MKPNKAEHTKGPWILSEIYDDISVFADHANHGIPKYVQQCEEAINKATATGGNG